MCSVVCIKLMIAQSLMHDQTSFGSVVDSQEARGYQVLSACYVNCVEVEAALEIVLLVFLQYQIQYVRFFDFSFHDANRKF